jgi:hypothetical protein
MVGIKGDRWDDVPDTYALSSIGREGLVPLTAKPKGEAQEWACINFPIWTEMLGDVCSSRWAPGKKHDVLQSRYTGNRGENT